MRISYWPDAVALNGKQPYAALLDSLSSRGYTLEKESLNSDAAVIWSVLWNGRMLPNKTVWNHYRSQRKPVVVAEVGSIQRGVTWRVALNGINRTAYFGEPWVNGNRPEKLGLKLKPWNTSGNHILICGQHGRSLQWENMPGIAVWLKMTIDSLKKHSSRDIIFRPHPRCYVTGLENQYDRVYVEKPKKVTGTYDDFDLKFDDAYAVVSWSSNPGIQSVVAGKPAFVGPDSIAWPVANCQLRDIENPTLPDRTQWLHDYASMEYTLDEISAGFPVDRLSHRLR